MTNLIGKNKSVYTAFRKNNLHNFESALQAGANPFERDPGIGYSVFEQACETPERKEFVKACIQWRTSNGSTADLNSVNPTSKMCPIHLAALSLDEGNLSELLKCDGLLVDNHFQDRTALFLLVAQITEQNWKRTFGNMKLLLAHGADVNETNGEGVAVLASLVTGNESWRRTVLEYCLKGNVYVDGRRGQLRKAIQKHFPDIQIPSCVNGPPIFIKLNALLTSSNEKGFLDEYNILLSHPNGGTLAATRHKELFTTAVKERMLSSAQAIVQATVRYRWDNLDTMETCCTYGYAELLEWLLTKDPDSLNDSPLLATLVKQFVAGKERHNDDYLECMRILLDDGRVDINKKDSYNCTALHHAVRYSIDRAQQLLLAKGAYLGSKNIIGDLPVSLINPSVLECHLDSCISDNAPNPGDDYVDTYELKIDFMNLVPPAGEEDDELLPITQMARSSDCKHLLRHPVVSSFLMLKWQQLSWCVYANTLLCTTFFVSLASYLAFCYGRNDAPSKPYLYTLSCLGLLYVSGREAFQVTLNWKAYFKSKANYIELALILASTTTLVHVFDDFEVRRYLSVAVIALAAVDFSLLARTLPLLSISTHMVMLETVARKFLKLLFLYAIIALVPFALGFYVIYQPIPSSNLKAAVDVLATNYSTDANGSVPNSFPEEHGNTNGKGEGDAFNNFEDIWAALLKTLVMFTGEFEAANLEFQQSVLRSIFFVLFLFLVYIVLSNVMNGVAVGDTTAIMAESELTGIRQRVFLIGKYEQQLKSLRRWKSFLPKCIPVDGLRLFPNIVPQRHIIINPNQSRNRVIYPAEPTSRKTQICYMLINGRSIKMAEEDALVLNVDKIKPQPIRRHKMDGKIVKYAEDILRRRHETPSDTQLRRMEMKLTQIEKGQTELRQQVQSMSSTAQSFAQKNT